ncbi:hypothetical protein ILUMI_17695 [Ignelater luminosus]|uniref:Peptidase S1 domain-containing protein n=1 Tax=Ignelater luminosus TaxID=2038154 RepID=A0A8K0G7N8_IGNLU|nr:hypothetical protein ILUMI_17695 [Ignelater luminosus]
MQRISIEKLRVRSNSEYWVGCNCGLAKEYKIHKIHVHPNFNFESDLKGDFDLALIATKGNWKGKYDKTSEKYLHFYKSSLTGTLTVLGWGVSKLHDTSPTDLRRNENLMILPSNFCQQHFPFEFSNQSFCVSDKNFRRESPCFLNHGGPLLISDVSSNQTTLIGIAAYTPPVCDESLEPALIVNVSLHADFINSSFWLFDNVTYT